MRIARTATALLAAAASIVILAGCAQPQPIDGQVQGITASSTPTALATAEAPAPVTVTQAAPATVTAPAPVTVTAPAPVTVTQAAPPPVVIVPYPSTVYPYYPPFSSETGVTNLPSGLYCRDLNAMGYSWSEAITYWNYWGQPDRMDIDLNGVPCETVY